MADDELRSKALNVMLDVPREVKLTLRGANALVGLLSGLMVDCEQPTSGGMIRVSCTILRSALTLAEHVRDKASVVAQQSRVITTFLGDSEAWERINGEGDGDG